MLPRYFNCLFFPQMSDDFQQQILRLVQLSRIHQKWQKIRLKNEEIPVIIKKLPRPKNLSSFGNFCFGS